MGRYFISVACDCVGGSQFSMAEFVLMIQFDMEKIQKMIDDENNRVLTPDEVESAEIAERMMEVYDGRRQDT